MSIEYEQIILSSRKWGGKRDSPIPGETQAKKGKSLCRQFESAPRHIMSQKIR